MKFSRQAMEEGYARRFDDRTRAAHLATLLHAHTTREDHWPNVGMVRAFAKLFGVSVAELGAFFGLLMRKEGNREVWVDVMRGPVNPAHAIGQMTPEQTIALGYGRMLAG